MDDAHRAGLLVHPWTFRSEPELLAPGYERRPEREYEQFYALGGRGGVSDFPQVAVGVQRSSGEGGRDPRSG